MISFVLPMASFVTYSLITLLCTICLPASSNCKTEVLNVHIMSWGTTNAVSQLGSLPYTAPPLLTAINEMQAKYPYLNISVKFIYDEVYSSCYDFADNIDDMVSRYYYTHTQNSISNVAYAFVGAGCADMINMGRMAANWNIPLITSVASSLIISDKAISPTWITTSYFPQGGFVTLYLNLIKKFQWVSPYIVVDQYANVMFNSTAKTLHSTMARALGIQPYSIIYLDTRSFDEINKTLDDFRRISRVMLYFGNAAPLRNLMLTAYNKNLTNGEFIYIAMAPFDHIMFGNFTWKYGDRNDNIAYLAFRSLMLCRPADVEDDTRTVDRKESYWKLWRQDAKSYYDFAYSSVQQPRDYQLATFAAISMLASVIHETYNSNPKFNFRDGRRFTQLFLNRTFDTEVGSIAIDSKGFRQIDLVVSMVIDNNPEKFRPFLRQYASTMRLIAVKNFTALNNRYPWPPPNEPVCGYLGDKGPCATGAEDKGWIYGFPIGLSVALLIVVGGVIVIRIKREQSRSSQFDDPWWIIHCNELSDAKGHGISCVRDDDNCSVPPPPVHKKRDMTYGQRIRSCSTKAIFRGGNVWLKMLGNHIRCDLASIGLTNHSIHIQHTKHSLLAMFEKLRKIRHDNLIKFVGVTVFCDPANTTTLFTVYEYSAKGSVHDLFLSEAHLDQEFWQSMTIDFVEGLLAIHSSPLSYLGRLMDTSCLIDRNFTLKLGGLGHSVLSNLLEKSPTAGDLDTSIQKRCWMPPETATNSKKNWNRATDVFGSGIILYELINQKSVYLQLLKKTPVEDLRRRLQNENKNPLSDEILTCDTFQYSYPSLDTLVRKSLCSDPIQRPSIAVIANAVKKTIFPKNKGSKLIERVLQRLEKLSTDLEIVVVQRTKELAEERRKTDDILKEIFPEFAVLRLRNNEAVAPEMFDSCSLMFSGLCGFSERIVNESPLWMTKTLDEIYYYFDPVITTSGAYKVETIGDSCVER
ncbi:atrial natriuretic peptide receptor 1-like isoform X2 [Paramacrobiotus metropolitanus]|uniref:atrial natriuretic peptide receptor 1-like isoform X2 n=1 Tax=Paramacrobiotus metropolitanus TaxID=2943436 RepID=UPI00244599D4|nr:atrial natriuretic peptide receptor 1-like isoform X2 [Paramacrobiotus metropolitanus]